MLATKRVVPCCFRQGQRVVESMVALHILNWSFVVSTVCMLPAELLGVILG